MAVTSIMTSEVEIDAKAGANASGAFTDPMKDAAVLQGESMVNDLTRFNFSDAVTAGLNADVQGIFSDVVSSFVAIQWIAFDMSGFTSRIEAEDMINVLRDGMLRGLSLIRDKKVQDFINGA